MPNRIKKKHLVLAWLLVIGSVLLVLNLLTPCIADDWAYMLSFQTKEPLRSVWDIFPSMYVHSYRMNGRLVSHGLVQLFFLFPEFVFDLVNSLVACLLLYLCYRICCPGEDGKDSPWLLVLLSAGFWCVLPAFGEVVLWHTGAINYLWGLLFGVLYLLPFLQFFLQGNSRHSRLPFRLAFTLFSVFVGLYTEITSLIVIGVAVLLLLSCFKSTLKTWLWWPVAGGVVGYLILLSMPAELSAKTGDFALSTLLAKLVDLSGRLFNALWPLLLLWLVLMPVCLIRRKRSRRLWLSAVFFIGAIAAGGMLIAASYYALRCLCTSVMLLLLADGVLLGELFLTGEKSRGKTAVAAVFSAAVLLCFARSAYAGCADIYRTHRLFSQREELIAHELAAGKRDLDLPVIPGSTKYSVFWELRDLSTTDRNTWPNVSMAKYYGADTVIGH